MEKKATTPGRLFGITKFFVTIGLLWWLLHDPARRADMAAAVSQADPWWLLAAFLSAGACEFFGIIRWHLFLTMLHLRVSMVETTRLFFIGAFFSQFLPGTTGGDVARVVHLMRAHPDHRAAGLLSVAVDRFLAMLVLVVMGLAFAWGRSGWFDHSATIGSSTTIFTIMLFSMAVGLAASFALTKRHLVERLPAKMPFREGVAKLSRVWRLCLENRREALLGTFHTVPMLLAYFATFYFAARAFTPKVDFLDMMSIMPIVTVISSLPVSLNGIGVREALLDEILHELCGTAKGTGMLASITGMAVYLLWSLPGAWFQISHRGREAAGTR